MRLSRTAMLVTVASLAFAAAVVPTLAQMKEQTVTVGGSPMYPSKNIIQNAVKDVHLLPCDLIAHSRPQQF